MPELVQTKLCVGMLVLSIALLGTEACGVVAFSGSTPTDMAIAHLSSPSQTVRDNAAAVLRASFKPASRAPLDAFVRTLKKGDTQSSVLGRLRPFHAQQGPGVAGGGTAMESYRLNDTWTLRCWYDEHLNDENARQRNISTLLNCYLIEDLRYVWVDPPPGLTGAWTTYFVNGKKSHALHYENGHRSGECTTFRADGSKAVVSRYGPQGIDGEEIGYYVSGKIASRGYYKDGVPVGVWTWYSEDGSIKSTEDHSKK